jgi:hypothetical protein
MIELVAILAFVIAARGLRRAVREPPHIHHHGDREEEAADEPPDLKEILE